MTNPPPTTFYGLGIAPGMLERLEQLKFVQPTPIQVKAIPIGIRGEDLVGIAQTGTGKTLAFAIPMIQRLSATRGRGLVLLPTRELALQVDEALKKFGHSSSLRTAVLIGGAPMYKQIRDLHFDPHIIIATPGRLIDHLQQRTVSLQKVSILVLDEADRMLDMGFEPQIKTILKAIPADRQTMLFSATMPEKIGNIAKNYMKQPLRVEVAPSGTTVERVEQELFIVPKNQRLSLLEKLLSEYHGTVLIFSRTKYGAKAIARTVHQMGHTTAELHSNRSLNQRKEALEGFKRGRYRVLVATDIAARGLDVTGIELVINFDLPDNSEDYVHRIGRTARAGRTGKAISFATPDQRRDVQAIEYLIRARLPVMALPKLAGQTNAPSASFQQNYAQEPPRQRSNRFPSNNRFPRNNSRRRRY